LHTNQTNYSFCQHASKWPLFFLWLFLTGKTKFEAGARMIVDAILLTVAEISAHGEAKLPVAIFPGMQLGTSDGISIINPKTKFQVWLTGNVDYGICTYSDEDGSYQGENCVIYFLALTSPSDRVLYAAVDDILSLTSNCIPLVIGKHNEQKPSLYDSMPEAIIQAMALSEVTKSVLFIHINKIFTQYFFILLQDEGNSILPIKWTKLDVFTGYKE
jgi:hypothetical protein